MLNQETVIDNVLTRYRSDIEYCRVDSSRERTTRDLLDCITVAEEANSMKMAVYGTNLSSKRNGKDTYFWIIDTHETEGMLLALYCAKYPLFFRRPR